jgi:hypothetical protein
MIAFHGNEDTACSPARRTMELHRTGGYHTNPGYRTGALTETQVRRLLQLETRFQVHALLKEHHVPLQYTEADLEDDLRAQREIGVLPGR